MINSTATKTAAGICALSLQKFHWKTERDIAPIEDLFDDSLMFVHINGYVSSKDEWVDAMRSGRFIYERITPKQNATVRLQGEVATLEGRAVFEVNMRGFRAAYDIGYTEVYERKGGTWKLVSLKTMAY